MKTVATIFLLGFLGGLVDAYEANGLPPLIPLRPGRKTFGMSTMATFGGAAAGAAVLTYFASGDKDKLQDLRDKLLFRSNIMESESRVNLQDRSAYIGAIGQLAVQAGTELDGINQETSARISDLKAVINNAMRQQSSRITKVLGNGSR